VCFWEEVAWNADHVLDGVRSEGMRFHPSAGKIEDSLVCYLVSILRKEKLRMIWLKILRFWNLADKILYHN